ncbi:unnamed protein product [Porites evermanni]|uniref:Uncharacterized protein n=1 Tax=Porites evermanni TaxID=104178 RepID=A0ABN8PBB4_9CNID|nr:unnamed protein product [Porites evermanni]
MFNVLKRECTSAKDLGKGRMRQDAEDGVKLDAQFTKYKCQLIRARPRVRRVIVALESGRDVDVNTLLQSELATVPKSLATLDGSLPEAGKSDLGTILQGNVCKRKMPISRSQTCTIIDGMAAIQSLANSSGAKPFGDLAHFLSTEISESYSAPPGRELVISGGFKDTLRVWSSDTSRQDIRQLASDHEEADTRIVLHARDAAARGYKQVNILCRDTDVLVLLLAHRERLCP